MIDALAINGKRYKDRRGKTYKVLILAKDVQTGEQIVVYNKEFGEEDTLCCPYDAFNMSMTLIDDEESVEENQDKKRPMTGEERMIAILDTNDFEEKSALLKEIYIRGEMTDSIIDNLAAALDVVIEEGDIQRRFDQLRICIDTRARYESTRLR